MNYYKFFMIVMICAGVLKASDLTSPGQKTLVADHNFPLALLDLESNSLQGSRTDSMDSALKHLAPRVQSIGLLSVETDTSAAFIGRNQGRRIANLPVSTSHQEELRRSFSDNSLFLLDKIPVNLELRQLDNSSSDSPLERRAISAVQSSVLAAAAQAALSGEHNRSVNEQKNQKYVLLQNELNEFRRKLERSKERNQKKLDDLAEQVYRLRDSFSCRSKMNDDLNSELISMLIIISKENPYLKLNLTIRLGDSSLRTTSTFSANDHKRTIEAVDEALYVPLAVQSVKQRRPLIELGPEFADQTFIHAVGSSTAGAAQAAVSAAAVSYNKNDDDYDNDDDGVAIYYMSTAQVVGDNPACISQRRVMSPETALLIQGQNRSTNQGCYVLTDLECNEL